VARGFGDRGPIQLPLLVGNGKDEGAVRFDFLVEKPQGIFGGSPLAVHDLSPKAHFSTDGRQVRPVSEDIVGLVVRGLCHAMSRPRQPVILHDHAQGGGPADPSRDLLVDPALGPVGHIEDNWRALRSVRLRGVQIRGSGRSGEEGSPEGEQPGGGLVHG